LSVERRRELRVAVSITAIAMLKKQAVRLCIDNLSASGANLIGATDAVVGDLVQLLFEIEDMPIDVAARVVRCERASRFSVEFLDLDDRIRAHLRAFVKQQISLGG